MKFFLRLLLVATALTAAASLRAQTLWPGTTSGMTVVEVQHLFPTAHLPDDPVGLPKGKGAELLRLDQVPIAGHNFTVRFFFKRDQLVTVALTETGEIPTKDFEKFRDLLRRRYNLEYSTVSSESILVTWKIAQTVITLTWTPLRREVATLVISYEAPILKETERL